MDFNPFRYKDASAVLTKDKKMTTTRQQISDAFEDMGESILLMDIDFNCVGAWVGEQTPIIVHTLLM